MFGTDGNVGEDQSKPRLVKLENRLMLDKAAQNCTVVLSRRIVMNFWIWQKKGDFG